MITLTTINIFPHRGNFFVWFIFLILSYQLPPAPPPLDEPPPPENPPNPPEPNPPPKPPRLLWEVYLCRFDNIEPHKRYSKVRSFRLEEFGLRVTWTGICFFVCSFSFCKVIKVFPMDTPVIQPSASTCTIDGSWLDTRILSSLKSYPLTFSLYLCPGLRIISTFEEPEKL